MEEGSRTRLGWRMGPRWSGGRNTDVPRDQRNCRSHRDPMIPGQNAGTMEPKWLWTYIEVWESPIIWLCGRGDPQIYVLWWTRRNVRIHRNIVVENVMGTGWRLWVVCSVAGDCRWVLGVAGFVWVFVTDCCVWFDVLGWLFFDRARSAYHVTIVFSLTVIWGRLYIIYYIVSRWRMGNDEGLYIELINGSCIYIINVVSCMGLHFERSKLLNVPSQDTCFRHCLKTCK